MTIAATLKSKYLHSTVSFSCPFSEVYIESTYSFQCLLEGPLKANYLHILVSEGGLLKAEYLLMTCFVGHYMSE